MLTAIRRQATRCWLRRARTWPSCSSASVARSICTMLKQHIKCCDLDAHVPQDGPGMWRKAWHHSQLCQIYQHMLMGDMSCNDDKHNVRGQQRQNRDIRFYGACKRDQPEI
jgi:hypothetical protein